MTISTHRTKPGKTLYHHIPATLASSRSLTKAKVVNVQTNAQQHQLHFCSEAVVFLNKSTGILVYTLSITRTYQKPRKQNLRFSTFGHRAAGSRSVVLLNAKNMVTSTSAHCLETCQFSMSVVRDLIIAINSGNLDVKTSIHRLVCEWQV